MPTLRQVLDAATTAYYGGERDRSSIWDRMPRIGGALGLVRDGAGSDEGSADVAGAVAAIDGYIERLMRVRTALTQQWLPAETPPTPATPQNQPDQPAEGGEDPCPPRTPPPSSRRRLPD